ncbi:10699_t:CDS:2 [Ambispora leptoticha]|uniref:RBR-type E3 ubiquitin transferase n=1 Tax=Ambispora leptoticha TaxID=144679 RepID=A0A9N9BR46_9GLOM|nr:10699_t:CDS:2 [Ambispora leptoticha]
MVVFINKCIICFEPTRRFEKVSEACGHECTCRLCVRKHIEAELNTKTAINIRCPKPGCRVKLTYHDIKRLVSKETFERYDNLLLCHAIRKLKDFRWCKNPECGSGQEHTTGDDEPIMTCIACHSKSCFTHDVPWHKDHTCDEFSEKIQTENETANQAYHDSCLAAYDRILQFGNHHHKSTCQYYSAYDGEDI